MVAEHATAAASRHLAAGPEPAVELVALTKTYGGAAGVRAVDGIDLGVAPGEMFGLLGPNGAGKSTTVGICTTRIRPTSGTARIQGLDVGREPSRVKRRIGVVTQVNTLDRSCTLRENLELHGRYFGWPARRARQRADELLERFRLADRHRAFPTQISGGMAQRLQVARAIAHEPAVLFLDEPTAGLDPQSRIALWELVQELRGDGLTVVLTTHHMEEAEALCDRVAIIDHGRVLVDDTPSRLIAAHGGARVVDLTFARPPSREVLERLTRVDGAEVLEAAGDRIRLRTGDRDDVLADVVAATTGAGLSDVSRSGADLEAVFIGLTGRDLRE